MRRRYVRWISLAMALAVAGTSYAGFMQPYAIYAYTQKEGTVTGSTVNVRSGPGTTYSKVTQLTKGAAVSVVGEAAGTDGYVWYQISFTKDGSAMSGYMRSDYVSIQSIYEEKDGYVTADNVNVRTGAGTSNSAITQLNTGHQVHIVGEAYASNGILWYHITFTKDGTQMEGYMSSYYIRIGSAPEVVEPSDTVDDTDYEVYLEQQGFPESYRQYLRSLHKINPLWVFVALPTGQEWSTALDAESALGVNLVPASSILSYKSLESGAIDWTTKSWKGYDGASWVAASRSVIKYYLDPRAFLTGENTMLQFESLEFEERTQTKAGVESILKGTHMEYGKTTINGEVIDFAQIFMDAGRTYNISPYHLASRAKQETGVNGSNSTYQNKTSGYEQFNGYYNFFNIKASPGNGHDSMYNGLSYAQQQGWDSPKKSIMAGAQFLASGYVAKGQSTMYLQKFDVVDGGNGYYRHQYMTNLVPAASEAKLMEKTYSNYTTAAITYIVPVYNNMPDKTAVCPTDDGSPYSVLSDLHINGLGFSEEFDPYTFEYKVPVEVDAQFIGVDASAYAPGASIGGTGVYALAPGENRITVTCTGSDGSARSYTIIVNRRQPEVKRMKGDVNNDNVIDSMDALEVLRASIQAVTLSEEDLAYADLNGNGTADAEDAKMILDYITGVITTLE